MKDLLERCETEMRYAGWTTLEVDNPQRQDLYFRVQAALAQPAQEPVAWLDEEKKIIYWHNTHETDDYHGFRRTTPLYTTPQQRPWVGLTHDERYECIHGESVDAWDIAEAVEAKLKEKTT